MRINTRLAGILAIHFKGEVGISASDKSALHVGLLSFCDHRDFVRLTQPRGEGRGAWGWREVDGVGGGGGGGGGGGMGKEYRQSV